MTIRPEPKVELGVPRRSGPKAMITKSAGLQLGCVTSHTTQTRPDSGVDALAR
jgi:hypothetical protein